MKDILKHAQKNRIFQDVIDQVEDAILQGKLKVGDKLPPERELTGILGASRGTVREALRVLEEKGLITVKTGMAGGAVIKSVPPGKVTESLARVIRSQQVSMEELAEFRQGIEGLVAFLAAERAGPKDTARLTALLKKVEVCLKRGISGWEDLIEADNRLHSALAEIAGNTLYRMVLDSVHENITRYYDRLLARGEDRMSENYKDLKDIVEAVRSGNGELALCLARDHVKKFSRYMKAKEIP
jgi:DNA-binding FadR family transcriptional regulator